MSDLLFYKRDLYTELKKIFDTVEKEVDGVPEKQFLSTSDEKIVEQIFLKLKVMPIELREEDKEIEPLEGKKIDVSKDFRRFITNRNKPFYISGSEFVIIIPFSGYEKLWECKPSTYTLNPPIANIDGNYLKIVIERPSDSLDVKEIKKEIEKTLINIREYLGWIRNDVEKFNQDLKVNILRHLTGRRKRLEKHAEIVEAFNIPLKRRSGAPDISHIPLKIRTVHPLPEATQESQDPRISSENYEKILNFIRHVGRTFEITPKTFNRFEEEELRDIIVAFLNGYFEGGATGETFRVEGDTDIRIEEKDRSAFIAECKVWRGQSELKKGINQLLGYLTWRDCKNALVIFNKDNAGFTEIQNKLPQILEKHSNFKRKEDCKEQGEWRYRLRSLEDEEREITVHVFLFNLYVSKKEKETKTI